MTHFIGLMSGTSLDGVDGVLAVQRDGKLSSAAHLHAPFEPALRAELLALNHSGPDELHRAALAANGLARTYAAVVQQLLDAAALTADKIVALGAHGQTVRHRPGRYDGTGYTLQLMNGALLAEMTGITAVCDLRSRDVAAGGQGAPLVPAFHAATFGQPGEDRAVLNLGGIANLSLLRADGQVLGFDTGPANVLLDGWCWRHRHEGFDREGRWAASGRVDESLLGALLAEDFFALPPPKSTGRDLFNASWLETRLGTRQTASADVMATLSELTARTVAQALMAHAPATSVLFVCGGGAFNTELMRRLQRQLPAVRLLSTAALGVAPDQVEALAFAWLARACLDGQAGNLPAVTGARGPRVLGAIYPAG